jgi:hypothetical protein
MLINGTYPEQRDNKNVIVHKNNFDEYKRKIINNKNFKVKRGCVFYPETINVLNLNNCFLITGVIPPKVGAGVTEVILPDTHVLAITPSERRMVVFGVAVNL